MFTRIESLNIYSSILIRQKNVNNRNYNYNNKYEYFVIAIILVSR